MVESKVRICLQGCTPLLQDYQIKAYCQNAEQRLLQAKYQNSHFIEREEEIIISYSFHQVLLSPPPSLHRASEQ